MATAHDDRWMENPVLAGRDQIQLLTSSAPPERPSRPRQAPAAIGRIIAELGLRYRPTSQTDLEAHGEALRLLTMDLADMPPSLLEKAAERWARTERFMPRASELIGVAQSMQRERDAGSDFARRRLQEHCDRLNTMAWCRGQWSVVEKGEALTIARAGELA